VKKKGQNLHFFSGGSRLERKRPVNFLAKGVNRERSKSGRTFYQMRGNRWGLWKKTEAPKIEPRKSATRKMGGSPSGDKKIISLREKVRRQGGGISL